MTVILSAKKCQQMLPPMIIFMGKTDQTFGNLIIPPGLIVKTHEKPQVSYDLMKIWVEEIWLEHTHAECKRPEFQNSVSLFDAFAAHLTDGVKKSIIGR